MPIRGIEHDGRREKDIVVHFKPETEIELSPFMLVSERPGEVRITVNRHRRVAKIHDNDTVVIVSFDNEGKAIGEPKVLAKDGITDAHLGYQPRSGNHYGYLIYSAEG